ncbi:hypothetical protein DQ04_02721090 [Trypanosoma grayi]|uniref:hypothetical protein n=1 Tax=Trypanosoma grayi TaxID=71804 RepID=UPI0004F42251|nr:hypothetical protein DQ04_02721090 [Trypanosoma grayi]KEG11350.1 hypothetical protein DQ04_02721090 [Trypanosoma grayi]
MSNDPIHVSKGKKRQRHSDNDGVGDGGVGQRKNMTHSKDIVTDNTSDCGNYYVHRETENEQAQAYSIEKTIANATGSREKIETELHAYQLVERDVTSLIERRRKSKRVMDEFSMWQDVSPHDVVRLNVGDEIFTVRLQLLLSKDGNLNYFDVLFGFGSGNVESGNALQVPLVDDTGALFIDRDPAIFRLALNYLRGYRLLGTLNEDERSMLRTDARYYQLHSLMKELGDQTTDTSIKLNPGPGVNPERNRFRVIYGVAVVGPRFLITGRHRITFQVTNSDYVGVGLVSDSCVSTDQEFHKTLNCCVYYMTGVFYSNFPHHRKEDGLETLEKDDYISLMVDMNKRVAEYTLKNTTKTLLLGNARKLRFAVATKLRSSIRIVPEEDAKHLPLFQKKPPDNDLPTVNQGSSLGEEQVSSTQTSQPNGAGSVSFSELTLPPSQQQQGVETVSLTRFLNVNTRPFTTEGLGRAGQPFVLYASSIAPLPGMMGEPNALRFVSGSGLGGQAEDGQEEDI